MVLHCAITLDVCEGIKNMCQLRRYQLLWLKISPVNSPDWFMQINISKLEMLHMTLSTLTSL